MRILWQSVATLLVGAGCLTESFGQDPVSSTLPTGLVLIGVQTDADSKECSIRTMSEEGNLTQTLVRHENSSVYPGGCVSRNGERVAYCLLAENGEGEFRAVDAAGTSKKIADGKGMVTAWSHDGSRISLYRPARDGKSFESVVIDVKTGKETILKLPPDYVADDWHPNFTLRTALYMNPRNRMYRKKKGDTYPARQLDLLSEDGTFKPITKNPSTDNIWSRFSPDGKRIAHYGRTLDGETALEYAVVCQADGSEPKVIFEFTKFGKANGALWFRPNGPPAWSPDGSTLAWRVSSNAEANSSGEKLELLLAPVEDGEPRRILLAAEKGIRWVSGVDWR